LKEIDLTINTMAITSIIDINSKSLGSVFPGMKDFLPARDVVLEIKIDKAELNFVN
jgi:hypothetical protein